MGLLDVKLALEGSVWETNTSHRIATLVALYNRILQTLFSISHLKLTVIWSKKELIWPGIDWLSYSKLKDWVEKAVWVCQVVQTWGFPNGRVRLNKPPKCIVLLYQRSGNFRQVSRR